MAAVPGTPMTLEKALEYAKYLKQMPGGEEPTEPEQVILVLYDELEALKAKTT